MSIFTMEQLKSELTAQCMTLDVLDEAQADVTFDACQIFSTLEEAVRLLVFIMNTEQQVQLE